MNADMLVYKYPYIQEWMLRLCIMQQYGIKLFTHSPLVLL